MDSLYQCGLCNITVSGQIDILKHIQAIHDESVNFIDRTLSSQKQFDWFFEKIQSSSDAKFVPRGGIQQSEDGLSFVISYRCNSELAPNHSANCTAYLNVRKDKLTGQLFVTGSTYHTGHDITVYEEVNLNEEIPAEVGGDRLQNKAPATITVFGHTDDDDDDVNNISRIDSRKPPYAKRILRDADGPLNIEDWRSFSAAFAIAKLLPRHKDAIEKLAVMGCDTVTILGEMRQQFGDEIRFSRSIVSHYVRELEESPEFVAKRDEYMAQNPVPLPVSQLQNEKSAKDFSYSKKVRGGNLKRKVFDEVGETNAETEMNVFQPVCILDESDQSKGCDHDYADQTNDDRIIESDQITEKKSTESDSAKLVLIPELMSRLEDIRNNLDVTVAQLGRLTNSEEDLSKARSVFQAFIDYVKIQRLPDPVRGRGRPPKRKFAKFGT